MLGRGTHLHLERLENVCELLPVNSSETRVNFRGLPDRYCRLFCTNRSTCVATFITLLLRAISSHKPDLGSAHFAPIPPASKYRTAGKNFYGLTQGCPLPTLQT